MAGSAESRNSEAVARRGGRLGRFVVLVGLVAGIGLAGCSTPAPPPAPAPSAAAEPPSAPEPMPAEPAVARAPELPVLTGMGPAELVALFGEPDFRRRDPPAELWQYRSADCVLDVFFYGEGGSYRVVRSETRDRHVVPPLVATCSPAFDPRTRHSRL